jgi:hypothetical protein
VLTGTGHFKITGMKGCSCNTQYCAAARGAQEKLWLCAWLFIWWNRGRQSDSHEKTRESLGKMFEIWRLQPPPKPQAIRVTRQVTEGKADDLTEINDQRFLVVSWIFRGRKQVESLVPASTNLLPTSLIIEVWILLREFRDRRNRRQGHVGYLPVLQVAALREDDEIALIDLHILRGRINAEIRREVRDEAVGKQVSLGEQVALDL